MDYLYIVLCLRLYVSFHVSNINISNVNYYKLNNVEKVIKDVTKHKKYINIEILLFTLSFKRSTKKQNKYYIYNVTNIYLFSLFTNR